MRKPGSIAKLTSFMSYNINEIIKSIFEKALELSQKEREEYFKNLSEKEKIYIDEVKSLISHYETPDDFLEIASNSSEIFSFDKNQPHPLIGKHIGSYLIEEEAGYGGMGIVFIGKRDDKEFEQKVAIKILKQGLSTKYLVKRFETERQILANLQHPNIAKLFDGGKTKEGLPYLIMEFIEGTAITDYCYENNLSINEKLKLFITVCSAVQYAHQNLIIHRDIKPGNILVNKEGLPKLLDFGIAKLLDENVEFENSNITQTKMWNLTPEYASPEQIKGENITTSSDIYSLGVLLYQLLSGYQPYRFLSNSPVAISKAIENDKIIKPSEFIKKTLSDKKTNFLSEKISTDLNEAAGKIKSLKGDLDNIVLKGMHKDFKQRYTSVQEFMDDITRYLKGLPVSAREDTVAYRLSKFVKRHKIGVSLFIIGNILAFVSIAAIIHQGNIAAKERDKAKVENKKYEKVNSFLQKMLSSVDPAKIGRDVKVYDVLEKAAKDVETELKNQPEIETAIRSTLGNTYVNLGEYDKAKPFLDKALEINTSLYGKASKETATSIHDLALYFDWIGEYKTADSLYGESINIFRKVLKEPTKIFADALNNHAIIKMNLSQNKKAEKLYLEAIKNSIKTYGEKDRNTAVMMNNIAINYMDVGRLDDAEKYYKKSLKIILEVLGANRPEAGSAYNNMARLYMYKSEFDSAEVYLKKSYNLKYKLKGKDHPDVGLALSNLGVLQVKRKDFAKAEKYFLSAIKQYRKTYNPIHPQIAISQNWLGKVYREENKLKLSEDYFRKSLKTRLIKLPENNWEVWETKGELGISLLKQKKYSEAEMFLIGTLKFYKKERKTDKNNIEKFTKYLTILYNETGDTSKAKLYQSELEELNQQR